MINTNNMETIFATLNEIKEMHILFIKWIAQLIINSQFLGSNIKYNTKHYLSVSYNIKYMTWSLSFNRQLREFHWNGLKWRFGVRM